MEIQFSKQRLIRNFLRYGIYFLAVVVTPWIFGMMFAPDNDMWIVRALDLVGYGQMRPCFKEVFTILFWILEIAVFRAIEKKYDPKEKRSIALTVSAWQEKTSAGTLENENEGGMVETNGEKSGKKTKKRAPLLPLRNVVALTAIVAACILILSAQIDFLVKPFYDLGEKIQGYDMYNRIAVIVRNVVKCVWIVVFLSASREIACELRLLGKNHVEKRGIFFGSYIVFFLLFGLYDVLTAGMTLGLGVTYFVLFYPCFVIVDMLTQHSPNKSYLLIMLIYIF